MVDSSSPVTIFTIDDIKEKMKRKTSFIRELPKDEHVDLNRRKLNLLGYICHLEVGESKLHKARILIAEKGVKSLIGRDWLNAFNYKFVSPNQKEGNQAISKTNVKSEQPDKLNKPREAEKSKKDIHNETNEQIILKKKQFNEQFTR